MDATIEVNDETYRQIEFAARMAGVSRGEIVSRLINEASAPSAVDRASGPTPDLVGIYADYEGHRTRAVFHRDTKRVDVVEGPLSGQSFKSVTGAAASVIRHYKPGVSPNRNGWNFWIVDDGTGRVVQSLR